MVCRRLARRYTPIIKLMNVSSGLQKVIKTLDVIERNLIIVLFSLMMGIVVFGVFMRYVFHYSLLWGQDLALVCFIWITLLGASAGAKQGKLIKVEALRRILPSSVLEFIQGLIQVCIFIFLLFLFKSGLELVKVNWATISPSLQLPISIYSVSIVVASLFMMFHYFLLVGKFILGRSVKKREG